MELRGRDFCPSEREAPAKFTDASILRTELPRKEGRKVFCCRFGLCSYVVTVVVQRDVHKPMNPPPIELAEATRQMPETQDRIASHDRVAVFCEPRAAVFGEASVQLLECDLSNQVHQFDRIIPLESRLDSLVSIEQTVRLRRQARTLRSQERAETE